MYSEFLRISGAFAVIDCEKWRIQATKCELFPLALQAAEEMRDTSSQLQQVKKEYIDQIKIWGFPFDLTIIIASYFDIDYILLLTFGKIQSGFKIHGYWRNEYLYSLRRVYDCMLIVDENGNLQTQISKFRSHEQPRLILEAYTPLMQELLRLKIKSSFVEDLKDIVQRYVITHKKFKKEISLCAPRIEFQYEEHCLFFIEFPRNRKGIQVGFIDYFDNAMRNKEHPVIWDRAKFVPIFCQCSVDDDEEDEGDENQKKVFCDGDCVSQQLAEVDTVMATIPTHLLSGCILPQLINENQNCCIS